MWVFYEHNLRAGLARPWPKARDSTGAPRSTAVDCTPDGAVPGEPVTRDRFLDVVWGYASFPTTRTVDNHIASLRAKIEKNPDDPKWIRTVHGVGYRFLP